MFTWGIPQLIEDRGSMNEFIPAGELEPARLTKQLRGDGYSFRLLLTVGKNKPVTLNIQHSLSHLGVALSLEG